MLVDLHGCLPITKVVFLPLSLPSRCSASGNRLVFSRISTQTNITMQVLPCGEALHGFDFASTSLEGTLIGVVYSVRSFRLLSLETSLDPKTLTLGPLLLVEDIIRSSKLLLLSRTNKTVENNRLYLALGKMKVLEFSLPSALDLPRHLSPTLQASFIPKPTPGTDFGICYAASFFHDSSSSSSSSSTESEQVEVAWGTVTNKVVLWPPLSLSLSPPTTPPPLSTPLATTLDPSTFSILPGHSGVVFSLSLSRDYIASTSDDRSVRLFDRRLFGRRDGSNSNSLVFTGWGHTSRVWDVAFVPTPPQQSQGPGPDPGPGQGPSTTRIKFATAGEDGTIRVWEYDPTATSPPPQSSAAVQVLRGQTAGRSVWSVASSPCGEFVASGGHEGCGKVWRINDATTTATTLDEGNVDGGGCVMGVCRLQWGWVVSCSTSGELRLMDGEGEGSILAKRVGEEGRKTTAFGAKLKLMPAADKNKGNGGGGEIVCAVGDQAGDVRLFREYRSKIQLLPSHGGGGFFSVQNLLFAEVDTLFALFIKGVVVQYRENDDEEGDFVLVRIYNTGLLTCVVTCLHFCCGGGLLVGGDSRGNIFVWDVVVDANATTTPTQTIRNVHSRAHVRDLLYQPKSQTLISVGHDGHLVTMRVVDEKGKETQKLKVVNGTNLSNTISALEMVVEVNGSVVVGGFKASNYLVVDVTNQFEILNIPDTGGWKRVHDVSFSPFNRKYSFVSCESNESQNLDPKIRKLEIPHPNHAYNYGINFHSSTTHCVAMFPHPSDTNTIVILSGGEDNLAKLSSFSSKSETQFRLIQELGSHESSVRGCCVSQDLLVTVGGKMETNYYKFDPSRNSADRLLPPPQKKKEKSWKQDKDNLDHRLNAVCAHVYPSNSNHAAGGQHMHIVFSGDSDGVIGISLVSTNSGFEKKFVPDFQVMKGRPILSIDVTAVSAATASSLLFAVGNTAGEVGIFLVNIIQGGLVEQIYEYKPHQCGTNALSIQRRKEEEEEEEGVGFAVASGGDDQAIGLCVFGLDESELRVKEAEMNICIHREASGSAIKGISYDLDTGVIRVVGYSQRIASFEVEVGEAETGLSLRRRGGEVISNVSDMSGMDVVGRVLCCVGDGIEFFDTGDDDDEEEENIIRAKNKIEEATHTYTCVSRRGNVLR